MSFRNLTRYQGNELAKAVMAFGRAVVLASVIALLFPLSGAERPVVWGVAGIVLGSVFVAIGVLLLRNETSPSAKGGKRRIR